MFVTYVLYSNTFDKIYIGYTANLIDRFKSHNQMATKGYTNKYRPWMVIHVEFYDRKELALKREKELKTSRGRNFIREQIKIFGLLSVS
jgi:putative endonuclease